MATKIKEEEGKEKGKLKVPELITLVSLGHGAKTVKEYLYKGWDPNVKNEDGLSPLVVAFQRGDKDVLCALLQAGAMPDIYDAWRILLFLKATLEDDDRINPDVLRLVRLAGAKTLPDYILRVLVPSSDIPTLSAAFDRLEQQLARQTKQAREF